MSLPKLEVPLTEQADSTGSPRPKTGAGIDERSEPKCIPGLQAPCKGLTLTQPSASPRGDGAGYTTPPQPFLAGRHPGESEAHRRPSSFPLGVVVGVERQFAIELKACALNYRKRTDPYAGWGQSLKGPCGARERSGMRDCCLEYMHKGPHVYAARR